MNRRKLIRYVGALMIILNVFVMMFGSEVSGSSKSCCLKIRLKADKAIAFQTFYSESIEMSQEKSSVLNYKESDDYVELKFPIDFNTRYIRLDFGDTPSELDISCLSFEYGNDSAAVDLDSILSRKQGDSMLEGLEAGNGILHIITNGEDPYLVLDFTDMDIENWIEKCQENHLRREKLLICSIIDIALLCAAVFAARLLKLPKEVWENRRLIIKLARNDFKTKYSGSYFGVFWAFVQPVITVVLYWFVFSVGLRATDIKEYPFVLWLIAGLVPWFYFADALNFGTNALIEYNYLVKKVVFNISILPLVKVVSALFVHLFFILAMLIIFTFLGYPPSVYGIQIIYYSFCTFCFSIALVYATSAIILFFKDMGQVITIVLQIGIWLTPIMWEIDRVPQSFRWLFNWNPMYYIVTGYRDAMLDKIWFFERIGNTAFFWLVTGGLLAFGTLIFRRLKPHFADVL